MRTRLENVTVRIRLVAAILFAWAAAVCPSMAMGRTVNLVASPYQNPGPSDDVVVAVTVTPADFVTSLDLVFAYDPAVLTPTGVFRTGQTASYTLSANLAMTGFVEIHLWGVTPLSGSAEVAWVTFRISATVETATSMQWVSAVLNGGATASEVADSFLTVDGPAWRSRRPMPPRGPPAPRSRSRSSRAGSPGPPPSTRDELQSHGAPPRQGPDDRR